MSEQTTVQMVPMWDLPDRLRKALRHADVGVQEIAEYLEVSRNTVSTWINGHHRPPAAAVRVWAERCDVPYEWLAHGIDRSATAPAAEVSRSTRQRPR